MRTFMLIFSIQKLLNLNKILALRLYSLSTEKSSKQISISFLLVLLRRAFSSKSSNSIYRFSKNEDLDEIKILVNAKSSDCLKIYK